VSVCERHPALLRIGGPNPSTSPRDRWAARVRHGCAKTVCARGACQTRCGCRSSSSLCSSSGVGAMIKIREIDHLVLRVADLEKMVDFYCRVIGCAIERRQDRLGLVQLRAGRSLIDLVSISGALGAAGGAAPGREGRNLDHFCLRVEPFDVAEIRAFLGENGVRAGDVESRYGAEGEGPSIYLSDPEGNVIEIKGPPSLQEQMTAVGAGRGT
jgi:glyoxylase I family protein